MNFQEFLNFAGFNFLFSFSIIFVTFIVGWILYNSFILKKICLKDSLFEKDNVAAWIEFIGAFIFPTLFLASKAIEGAADVNIWMDLLLCIGYAVVYVVVFTVLRLFTNLIIKLIQESDKDGKIHINNEIYEQKNIAAALFSVSLSVIFVGVVRFLDILGIIDGDLIVQLFKILIVLVFVLVAVIGYTLLLRRKTTLFKEIFHDNNTAAGVAFLGFIFAIITLLNNAIIMQKGEFDIMAIALMSAICLFIFGVMAVIFKWIFTKLTKVDIWKEVYEQNSIGAAIGQVALYVGIANVIINFMK